MSWEMVRLGDVCPEDKTVIAGKSSSKPYLGLEMIEAETGRIDWSITTTEGISTCYAFDVRHILYGKLRPYLNKVALPTIEGRCSTEIIPLLPQPDVCREYIAFFLRRKETISYIMPENTGSRMPRADMKHLLDMLIPLPPLDEQRRIAAALERQLAAVEKAKQTAMEQLSAARALKAAYLREAFEGNDWNRERLGQIGESIIGLTYSPDNVALNGTPVLRSGNIQNSYLDFSNMIRVQKNINESLLLRENDILICSRNGSKNLIGKSAFVAELSEPMTFGAFMTVYRSPYNRYIYYFFQSENFRQQLTRSATNTINQLTQDILHSIEVPLPPLDEQRRIAAALERQTAKTEKAISALQSQLDDINALPAALLRQAFSGRM